MNAAETLLATGCDGHVALQCSEQQITYRTLRRLVRQSAGAWQARGVRPGDRVFVVAPDSIDWVVTYLGIIWAGGVAVGVNPRLPANELEPILEDSEPSYVWCEGEDVAASVERMRSVQVPVVRNGPAWAAEVAAAPLLPPVKRGEEDPALWVGTSGTTGIPKGVIHVHRTVVDAHSFACGVLGADSSDRFYATSKLFFAYALGNSLFAGLRAGATVILDPEWPTPERVEQMVERHRPSLVFCVPTLYHKMLQTGAARRLAHTGIRHYVSAGEALPPTTRKGWREATALAPISGYGTSETLALMLYCDDDSGHLKPTPLTEITYTDDDATVPQRIWIRHSAIARGYWRRPEAQADSFRAGGWFSPGDMFLRHPHERLEYTGRNDDMLKIAGQWVSTLWVEQRLAPAGGDAVHQLAAVGVPTDEGLTALAVLAVAAPGQRAEANRRLAAAVEALPRHRRPRWVHWVDALPLTATGKLQRSALKALHAQALERLAVAA